MMFTHLVGSLNGAWARGRGLYVVYPGHRTHTHLCIDRHNRHDRQDREGEGAREEEEEEEEEEEDEEEEEEEGGVIGSSQPDIPRYIHTYIHTDRQKCTPTYPLKELPTLVTQHHAR